MKLPVVPASAGKVSREVSRSVGQQSLGYDPAVAILLMAVKMCTFKQLMLRGQGLLPENSGQLRARPAGKKQNGLMEPRF